MVVDTKQGSHAEFSSEAPSKGRRGTRKKKRSPLNPDLSLESDEEGAQGENESDQEEAEYSRKKKDLLDTDSDSEGEAKEALAKQSSGQKAKSRKGSATVAVVEKNVDENTVNDSMIVDRESSAIVSPARQDVSMVVDDKRNNYFGKSFISHLWCVLVPLASLLINSPHDPTQHL